MASIKDYLNELPEDDKASLEKLLTIKSLKKNEHVLINNNYSSVSIFVREGIIRKYIIKDGKQKTVDLFFKNEISIFPSQQFQPIFPPHFQALQSSIISITNMDSYDNLKDSSKSIMKLDVKILEIALAQVQYRLETFQFMNASERYLELLEKQPQIIHQVPLKHIASYLGINNASLSKIRASLKNKM